MFVIPAEAGIHVFRGVKWTPAFARVTILRRIAYFETGSNKNVRPKAIYISTK